jgi:hypothetical protein
MTARSVGSTRADSKPVSSWSVFWLYRSAAAEDRLRNLETHMCEMRRMEKAKREQACYEATSIVNWRCRRCSKRKNEHFKRLGQ